MSKKFIKPVIIIVVLASVIGLVSYLTRSKPISVTVTKAEFGSVESTVTNTRAGTVKACRRAKLAPHSGGQISMLAVKEGQKVVKDQILVELWNKDVKAQLLLAENEAKAAKASAREACTRYDTAKREAARATKMFKQKLASAEQTEQAQGNAKAASAACDAANDRANVALSQVDVTKANLERTIVRAPFDGIVAEINGELGEFVTPSPIGVPTLPVVDLIDYQCIYVSAPIDEVDAPAVREGQSARITLDAFPNHPFDATVHRIAPYIEDVEKQARTVDVEVYFAHVIGEQNLLPGYSADAEIILDKKENVLRIPTETLFEDNHVYVLHQPDNTVEKRQIKTGIGNWSYTEVVSGLNAGDTVITSIGVEGLKDGIQVQVSKETSQ